jgi:hypothetical protein
MPRYGAYSVWADLCIWRIKLPLFGSLNVNDSVYYRVSHVDSFWSKFSGQ